MMSSARNKESWHSRSHCNLKWCLSEHICLIGNDVPSDILCLPAALVSSPTRKIMWVYGNWRYENITFPHQKMMEVFRQVLKSLQIILAKALS